jgi:hypothetical protein
MQFFERLITNPHNSLEAGEANRTFLPLYENILKDRNVNYLGDILDGLTKL